MPNDVEAFVVCLFGDMSLLWKLIMSALHRLQSWLHLTQVLSTVSRQSAASQVSLRLEALQGMLGDD